ncbi:MAG: glutamate--tRNA ligase [Campylobacterales bacterium]|nr:glutamate--tRNA ligase [Campylobacterales bacterium]
MLRFAASTARDMSIGDLRVALFTFITSLQRKEDFIVRLEDTNTKKNIEGKDKEVLDILDFFKIKSTQEIYQSQNVRFHSAMALQLMHEKEAFSCFCSPEWIQKKIDEAESEKKPYLYDDACANLPAELVIDNLNPFTVRIHRPKKDITIIDSLQGELRLKADTIDSFMILKQDKTAMKDFATAIDDMLSDISLVIQSQEEIESAAKQEYIRAALSYNKKIEYMHIPNIENNDVSVLSLLESGYLPEAITNYLISISTRAPKEIFTLEEATEWFSFDAMVKTPVVFDIEALRAMNKEYLKKLDAKELSRYVGFADEEIGELARIYLQEASTTKELNDKIAPIFSKRTIPQKFEEQTKNIANIIKSAPYFNEYDAFESYIIQESGLQGEELLIPLRILLTNAERGPDIAQVYNCLKNYMGEIIK